MTSIGMILSQSTMFETTFPVFSRHSTLNRFALVLKKTAFWLTTPYPRLVRRGIYMTTTLNSVTGARHTVPSYEENGAVTLHSVTSEGLVVSIFPILLQWNPVFSLKRLVDILDDDLLQFGTIHG
jgi:hypothetical protein